MILSIFLLSSLMGSQNSLIPLVDDHQCGYITEFGEKKQEKPT
jgi:hypothetical protein